MRTRCQETLGRKASLLHKTMQHVETKLTSAPFRLSSRIAGRRSVFALRRGDLHYLVCGLVLAVNLHSQLSRIVESSVGWMRTIDTEGIRKLP
jgi:hypothetical protein